MHVQNVCTRGERATNLGGLNGISGSAVSCQSSGVWEESAAGSGRMQSEFMRV